MCGKKYDGEDEGGEDMQRRGLVPSGKNDVDMCGCGRSALCNPERGLHRYCMLVFMCFLSFGSYFCYDNPAALQSTIKRIMDVDTEQFELLYSLYSWPNVALSVLGGFLLDRVFGIRWGAIIFASIIFVGQVVFALGAQLNSFLIMEIGRFIFGLGGENLAVAQNAYAVSWFKGRELNMAFGLQLSFARMGSTVNMLTLEKTYNAVTFEKDYQRLAFALYTGVMYCLFSLFCAFVLSYFDKRRTRMLKLDAAGTGEVVRLRDIKDFPLSLWLLFIICVTYYVAIFPFISLGTVFFVDKFQMSSSSAHFVNSLVYLISLGASFLLGIMTDKTGLNLFWVIVSIFGTLVAHAMLAFSWISPYVSMTLMGVMYSLLACALWPMVALVVPEHQLGTAYGLMQAIQNLGLAVISMIAGIIVDTQGYLVLEVFFCANLCVALFCAVVLYLVDSGKGGLLNFTAKEREAHLDRLADASAPKDELVDPYVGVNRIMPRTASQLRGRYLSTIGVYPTPDHDGLGRLLPLSCPHQLK